MPMTETKDLLSFKYVFLLPRGERKEIVVRVDRNTLRMIRPERATYPEWTALENCKCANCPLQATQSPQCPAAASLVDVIETFGPALSYEETEVRVETENRTYSARTTMQKGLSGLIGLVMATSGCPILRKLRPLARFHLPFTSLLEAQFRILSMYLLSQHLRAQKGAAPDWAMQELAQIYGDIQVVNEDFTRRLRLASEGDANLNAVILLNTSANAVAFAIGGEMLEELKQVFNTASDE